MKLKDYFKRVVYPILIVLLFYLFDLIFREIDSKDRALVLVLIGTIYAILIGSAIWIVFRFFRLSKSEFINSNLVSFAFIIIGLYFIWTANDKETIWASILFIVSNIFCVVIWRKERD